MNARTLTHIFNQLLLGFVYKNTVILFINTMLQKTVRKEVCNYAEGVLNGGETAGQQVRHQRETTQYQKCKRNIEK